MILHHLALRLRQQDWAAVTIEFLLVVAGVFVGIQVANWNEERKQHALESAYLARIAEDVRSDVAELNEVIKVSVLRMALFNELLPRASGRDLPDGFDSARGRITIEKVPTFAEAGPSTPAFTLFILTPLSGHRSAYDTMINAGAIGGMRDAAALRRIQAYYAAVDRLLHYEVGLEQNRDKLVDAELAAGSSPVDPRTSDQLSAEFAANRRLLATAQNYWLYTNRHIKLSRELRAQALDMADYINQTS